MSTTNTMGKEECTEECIIDSGIKKSVTCSEQKKTVFPDVMKNDSIKQPKKTGPTGGRKVGTMDVPNKKTFDIIYSREFKQKFISFSSKLLKTSYRFVCISSNLNMFERVLQVSDAPRFIYLEFYHYSPIVNEIIHFPLSKKNKSLKSVKNAFWVKAQLDSVTTDQSVVVVPRLEEKQKRRKSFVYIEEDFPKLFIGNGPFSWKSKAKKKDVPGSEEVRNVWLPVDSKIEEKKDEKIEEKVWIPPEKYTIEDSQNRAKQLGMSWYDYMSSPKFMKDIMSSKNNDNESSSVSTRSSISDLTEELPSVIPLIDPTVMVQIESLGLFIADMYRYKSYVDILIAVVHFVKHIYPEVSLLGYIGKYIDEFATKGINEYIGNSPSSDWTSFVELFPTMDEFTNHTFDLFNSENAAMMKASKQIETLMKVISFMTVDAAVDTYGMRNKYEKINSDVRYYLPLGRSFKVHDFFFAVINLFMNIGTSIYKISRGESPFTIDPFMVFNEKVTKLESSVIRYNSGLLGEDFLADTISFDDFNVELDSLLTEYRGFSLKYMHTSAEGKELMNVYKTLIKLKGVIVEMKLSHRTRFQPFSIMIEGPPGIGKSTIAGDIMLNFARKHNLRQDLSCMYKYDNTKYMDGFSYDHWCVLIDDFLQENVSMSKGNGMNMANEFMTLISTFPKKANAADLESKGKMVVHPNLVLLTTNGINDAILREYVNSPTALKRRINFRILTTLKDTNEKSGRIGIDADKLTESNLDAWSFQISTCQYVGKNQSEGSFIPIKTCNSMYELMVFLNEESEKHINRARKINAVRDDLLSCKVCGILLKNHKEYEGCYDSSKLENEIVEVEKLIGNSPLLDERIDIVSQLRQYPYIFVCLFFESIHWRHVIFPFIILLFYLYPELIIMFGLIGFIIFKVYDFSNLIRISEQYHRNLNGVYSLDNLELAAYRIAPVMKTRTLFILHDIVRSDLFKIAVAVGVSKIMYDMLLKDSPIKDYKSAAPEVKVEQPKYVPNSTQVDKIIKVDTTAIEESGRKEWVKPVILATSLSIAAYCASSAMTRSVDSVVAMAKSLQGICSVVIKKKGYNNIECKLLYFRYDAFLLITGHSIVKEFDYYLPDEVVLTIVKGDGLAANQVFVFKENLMTLYLEYDLIAFNLAPYIPQLNTANIDSYFMTDSSILSKGLIIDDFKRIIPVMGTNSLNIHNTGTCTFTLDTLPEPINAEKTIVAVYKAPSRKGDCGGLGVGTIGKCRVIISHHVAGNVAQTMGKSRLLDLKILHKIRDNFKHPEYLSNIVPSYPIELSPLYHKSPLGLVPFHGNGIGSSKMARNTPKTRVEKTVMYDTYEPWLSKYSKGATYGPPIFKGYLDKDNIWIDPAQFWLRSNTVPTKPQDFNVWITMADSMMYGVKYSDSNQHILDINECINGRVGSRYILSLNKSTSAGHAHKGKKKDYFFEYMNELNQTQFAPTDELKVELDKRVDLLKKKDIIGLAELHVLCFKDEALKNGKMTRIFNIGDLVDFMINKIVFGPIVEFVLTRKRFFECQVGLNCMSKDWENFFSHLTRFGEDNIVDGDFKSYDVSLFRHIILGVCFHILRKIAVNIGYNESEMNMFDNCVWLMVNRFISMNSDIGIMYKGNPSGCFLTSVLNSLCSSLLFRYCFFMLVCSAKDIRLEEFRDYVSLGTYGDDNIQGISKDIIDVYNFTEIKRVLATVDMLYTPANKTDDDYIVKNIFETSFLKRNFRYDNGILKCPLELPSIFRSLCWYNSNKDVNKYEQFATILYSANRELWHHGQKLFDIHHKEFLFTWEDIGLNMVSNSHIESYMELDDIYKAGLYNTTSS